MMRIALVNDLAVALEGLRRVVSSIDGAEVAWTAVDGREAVERCRADTPDLILMDMVMPVRDGVEGTRASRQEGPCPVVRGAAAVGGHGPDPGPPAAPPGGRRGPEALRLGADGIGAALRRQGALGAASGRRPGVHLVDDHGADGAQRLARL